jgi:hypothetical protein
MELPPTDFESAEVVQSHTLSGHKIDENGQRSKNARSRFTPLQSTWPNSRHVVHLPAQSNAESTFQGRQFRRTLPAAGYESKRSEAPK